MLFDSHCHLTHERLRDDVPAILARARSTDNHDQLDGEDAAANATAMPVTGVVTIGSDVADARAAQQLAATHEGVWSSAGVHPHVADECDDAAIDELRDLAGMPGVVAIGETGLDYHYDNAPRATQRRVFERHLALADELGLPIVVHTRDADEDTAAMVRGAPAGTTGVLHCFSAGRALLDTAADADWYVSFSGLVTFDGFDAGGLVPAVPDNRLLIETDSPYLAPVPRRGRTNEPGNVRYVVRAVARLKDEPERDVARLTTRNARAFYGLEG